MNRKSIFAFVVGCTALLLIGCGPKIPYKVVPVKGVVTWQGEPLEGALLTFSPVETQGRPSRATTKADGSFEAKHTPDVMGVPTGKIVMTVLHSQRTSVTGEPLPIPEKYKALAEKYGPGTTGYELEITKPEKNLLIDLQ
ncbi:MAG: hypothetical protein Q4G68_12670 [Planctomycetia bacterium]|nr:hypothetical protein [Planctomycetia bacterium]